MKFALIILLSYLLGSIPWALVIGKVFYGKDIRLEGSGNLGGTNAGRVLGKKAGVSVIVLDALKGLIAMLIANMIAPETIIYAGLACCIGHCFPVFANFKGGKAVATSFGYLLGISTLVTHNWLLQFVAIVALFMIILYITKMVSFSSITSLLGAVIMSVILKNDISVTISLFILWAFVTYRHKANIERILKGEEKKITWM
ncbi:MAG: glycerol-3-phosphate 1-O-acyltransferase PlsY [Erysipelotrichaceae bacterium]|nr:glycerol-3-phosphate 1-O-acyltransferase PlsY [Erysipelotrichaceae bacterium]